MKRFLRAVVHAIWIPAFAGMTLLTMTIFAQEGRDTSSTPSHTAEKNSALPELNNKPVDDLLAWAREEIGCGFIFDRMDICHPSGEPLRITMLPGDGECDPVVLLFECLKSIGLVAMEVRGLGGSAYQIVPVEKAAGYADVTYDLAELDGIYFGTLALEARSVPLPNLVQLAKRFASKYGIVTEFTDTSVLIITDYIDNIRAVTAACDEAQIPAERDDDTVTETFKPAHHDAPSLRFAAEEARQADEQCTLTLHEPSVTLMLTGKRKDVQITLERLKMLDESPVMASGTIAYHTYDLQTMPANDAIAALNEFFAEDVRRLALRVAGLPHRRQLLIECNEARFTAVLEALKHIDPRVTEPDTRIREEQR